MQIRVLQYCNVISCDGKHMLIKLVLYHFWWVGNLNQLDWGILGI